MAPLALLYLGRAATGSLASGALLVGIHALAEALGAAPLGRRFDRYPVRREFTVVLAAEAAFFFAVAVLARSMPLAVLAVLAAAGGGIAAGAHGGLRSLAIRLAPAHARPILGVESATSTAIWTLAPALVAGITGLAGPYAATFAMAGFAALGAVLARWQAEPPPHPPEDTAPVRSSRLVVSSCAQAAAVMLAVGGLTAALVDLLPSLGTAGETAGLWLTALAGAGILGGLGYGARRWPGRPATQATVLIALLCAVVTALGFVHSSALALAMVLVVGAAEAPANAARSLALQQQVPQRSWSTAFSALYASSGIGYGAAGLLAAAMLSASGPRAAIICCAVAAFAIAVVVAVFDRGRSSRERGPRFSGAVPRLDPQGGQPHVG
ncbi:hypothetical protein HUW46_02257 [Amycolatopsis sp. CA-230715]|nr:MFS transporter [Amycolatopsis sp. CA-230715]QWF78859.1 hypothetical protein HUW46_02257 [Amycolatopsis sp. CA-230715]